ncbi:MAG: hypothetical protein ACXVLB_12900 [Acidimicrobiales bacterium]
MANGAAVASSAWIHTLAPKRSAHRSASATSSRWVSTTWSMPPSASNGAVSASVNRGESTRTLPPGRATNQEVAPNESGEQ